MVEGEIDRLLDEEKSKVEGGSEANDVMEIWRMLLAKGHCR
jgi:hypothetical protein